MGCSFGHTSDLSLERSDIIMACRESSEIIGSLAPRVPARRLQLLAAEMMPAREFPLPFPRLLAQHIVSEKIAAGGMASVHVAVSPDPTQPVLAVKRVHPHLASAEFTRMLLEEAGISASIRHQNVVTTYGADMIGDEVFLVMDYVPGLSLHVIQQRVRPGSIPVRFAVAIMADVLRGLHAAHEAVDANGDSMKIVHRDVSPQNILVGLDGIARVLDFGIATAERRTSDTGMGDVKGKLGYMAPEQLRQHAVDRRTDVYAAAVVLWQALVGESLFQDVNDAATYGNALRGCSTRPGRRVAGIPAALDEIVMRGLARRPNDRFATALDMACALDSVFAFNPVGRDELAAWLCLLGARSVREPGQVVADLSCSTFRNMPTTVRAVAPPARPLELSLLDRWMFGTMLFALGVLLGFIVVRRTVPAADVSTTVPRGTFAWEAVPTNGRVAAM